MPIRPRATGLLLLAVLFSLPAMAGNHRWTIHGPDGGSVDRLVYDPADSSIVYAGTNNGLFRSTDGGVSWTAAREILGTSVFDVAVANDNPQRVFASTVFGLFGSTDRGVTWRVAHGFASFQVAVSDDGMVVYSAATSGPIRSTDGGTTFGSTGTGLPPSSSVSGIVIDPQNPDTVYASLLMNAGVYKSVNGGAQWTAANSGLSSALYYALVIDPSNPATLYLGAGGAIYKSTDSGSSWSSLIQSVYAYGLAVSASAPSTIIAAADRGMLKSTNGGSSWSSPKLSAATAVAIDPDNPANVLAVTSMNLMRSTDGGVNYALAGSGLTAHYTQSIAVDPRNASTVYTSGPSGTFKSTDRGRSWTSIGSLAAALAVDPFDASTLYAISSGSVIRSVNGGATWQSFREGLPSGAASAIVTDPGTAGTLYALVGNTIYQRTSDTTWAARMNGLPAGFFPLFVIANGSTVYTGDASALFRSVDGAGSWTEIHGAGLAGLAVDPHDANHLFAWASGVSESKNGGTSWTTLTGLPNGSSIVFDPNVPGRIYARSGNGVRRSGDGGLTWANLDDADGVIDATILAVAPDGKTLYAGGTRGGIWIYDLARRRAASH